METLRILIVDDETCDPFDHHMGHYFAVVADLDALSED